MAYSSYTRSAILNWYWRGVATTPPATTYLALLTTSPTDDAGSGLVEMTTAAWTSYARAAIAASGWNAPTGTSPQTIINAAQIVPAGTASAAVTVTGFALYDAASAGNFLGWGTLNSLAVPSGDGLAFAAGALAIQE